MEDRPKDVRKIIPENIIRSVMDPRKGFICFYLFNPSKCEKEELKDLYKNYNSTVIGFAVHLPKVSINKNARINKKMQEEEKRTKLIETSTAIPNMAYTPALKLFNATIIPKHT